MVLKRTTRIILIFMLIFFLLQLMSSTPIFTETNSSAESNSEIHFNPPLIFSNNIILPAKVAHKPFFNAIAIRFISVYLIGLLCLCLINCTIYYRMVLFDNRKYIKKIITQHIEGNKYKYLNFII